MAHAPVNLSIPSLLCLLSLAWFAPPSPAQVVDVTSWGFDPDDSTPFLQAAIDSGAETVIVPNVGADWVITPITLAHDQEIIFEPCVVVTAKPGHFQGTHDSLFNATDTNNTIITAYHATFRMQKQDYISGGGGGFEDATTLDFGGDGADPVTIIGWGPIPNLPAQLAPPIHGPFHAMTSGDLGQGYNDPSVRSMLWWDDHSEYAYTHTDGITNLPDSGMLLQGATGPILRDPTDSLGRTAYPALHFIAPVSGSYGIDGTATFAGLKGRCYVQYVTNTYVTTLGPGWSTSDTEFEVMPIDFGAQPVLQNIWLNAGEGISILIYTSAIGAGGYYPPAEWRSAFNLNGVSHFTIRGGTIRDTGGDGVLLGDWGKGYNDNITIRAVNFDNNYRQGISIISAQDVLIEDCLFQNTNGHGPAAGIDMEPDYELNRLVNVVVRDCVAQNNQGPGFIVSPAGLDSNSMDISVLLDNCDVTSGQGHGLMVSAVKDNGPAGLIEFRNCDVQNVDWYGLRILDKSSTRALVRFQNVTLKNTAQQPPPPDWYPGVEILPIMIHLRSTAYSTAPGGIEFINCLIEDDQNRPFIAYRAPFANSPPLHDVTGNLRVNNPYGAQLDLGSDPVNVNLIINQLVSPLGDLDANYKVDLADLRVLAGAWLTEGPWVPAEWLFPNFPPALEPPSNDPFIPMTSSDFGQGYNNSNVRAMLWDPANNAYTATDSTRTINHFDHGNVTASPNGPIIDDPDGGLTSFPSIHFIAPNPGTFSLDGTATVSGSNTRVYVQHVTATTATTLAGWHEVTGPLDFGGEPALQNLPLDTGQALQIIIYNDTTLDLGGNGTDPVKVIDGAGGTIQLSPLGDLNQNFRVDLPDFALMIQNWLLDCIIDYTDPACQ